VLQRQRVGIAYVWTSAAADLDVQLEAARQRPEQLDPQAQADER